MSRIAPAGAAASIEVLWWSRVVVVIGWFVASAAAFTSVGDTVLSETAVHAPFVGALTGVAAATAVVAWRRHRVDESMRTFLLALAFGSLAVLYAPHVLLSADETDPTHLVFGPISRAAFCLLLTFAVLVPETSRTRAGTRRWFLVLVTVGAVAVDGVVHAGALEGVWGDDPESFVRGVEAAALGLSLGTSVVLAVRWQATRRPLLGTMALVLFAMALGSGLFLSTDPWTGRWWTAHLALVAASVLLVTGLLEEGFRRGRLERAMDLDGLGLVAEHIVEDLHDGLAVFDDRGDLVGWNPAARAITGWERSSAAAHLHPDGPDGIVQVDEGRWIDIRRLTVERHGSNFSVLVFADARDRVVLEHATAELSQANDALRDFAAVAAHDIRSPLTVVKGMVELLDNPATADPETQRAALDAVRRATDRLTRITQDVLELSSLDSGGESPDPRDVVAHPQLALLVEGTGVRLDVPADVGVHCDPDHLDRMVSNLLSNADRYGAPPIEVSAAAVDDGMVEIVVRDHGDGVDEEVMDKLFRRFGRGARSRELGGTGLGLAIVSELVNRNRGSVSHVIPEDGGAAFVLRLPAASVVTPRARAPQRASEPVVPVDG